MLGVPDSIPGPVVTFITFSTELRNARNILVGVNLESQWGISAQFQEAVLNLLYAFLKVFHCDNTSCYIRYLILFPFHLDTTWLLVEGPTQTLLSDSCSSSCMDRRAICNRSITRFSVPLSHRIFLGTPWL